MSIEHLIESAKDSGISGEDLVKMFECFREEWVTPHLPPQEDVQQED